MIKSAYLVLLLLIMSSMAIAQSGKGKPLFTFGVVSDVQYCDCDITGTRHYRASIQKLNAAIDSFNKRKVDFVISLGDFIDHDIRSYDTLNVLIKRLKSPLHHVMGNHDFSVEPNEIKKIPALMGLKKTYYSFKKKGWRFIALNGNEFSVYATANNEKMQQAAKDTLQALKDRKLRNAQLWNGDISDIQFSWLKNQLDKAQKANERVIVLCHFPIAPDQSTLNLWHYKAVKNLIGHYTNVFAYLNGHDHKGGYNKENGIHHLNFKGMVENNENAFAIVYVYPDHLVVKGAGVQQDFMLK